MAAPIRSKPVRIAVIGDERAGKTSLVVAAANESFPDVCPPVVPPAILPADCTPEGVPLHLIDTSSRPEERTVLEQTCLGADVIVLCFDASRQQPLKRVGSHWMPELRRLGVHVPVILVGTKVDLARQDAVAAAAQPVLRRWRQIESCLTASAKHLTHVVEVFYFALKAVIHPVAPLFDPHAEGGQGALRPLCVRALKRVFLMNDADKDGVLSDAELNAFQISVFAAPLQPEELTGVRRVVSEAMPQGVNATGLTLPGFLFLHALFIERGRLETVWAVLRRYGYGDSLLLSQEVLSEVPFARGPDQVAELTEAGRNFLSERFVAFDRDGDKLLSAGELGEMFSTAPAGPWKGEEYRSLLVESEGDALTLPGFLAKWAFTTARDPVRTLAFLRYLGFQGPGAPLFAISKPRRVERRAEALARSVVQVHVVLGGGAGKGLLLAGLAGKPPDAAGEACAAAGEVRPDPPGNGSGSSSGSSGSGGSGGGATLILQEHGAEALEGLERDPEALARADAAAFTFDAASADSFRQAHAALLRLAAASDHSLPCVLVAVEAADGGGMSQELVAEVAAACASLELRQPFELCPGSAGDLPALLQGLLAAAAAPDRARAIPQTAALKAAKRYQRLLRLGVLYTLGGAAAGVLCYAVYKASRRSGGSSSSEALPADASGASAAAAAAAAAGKAAPQ